MPVRPDNGGVRREERALGTGRGWRQAGVIAGIVAVLIAGPAALAALVPAR